MLILVKPDAVAQVGDIIQTTTREWGKTLISVQRVQLDVAHAADLYAEHVGKDFFGPLVQFMTLGECYLLRFLNDNDRTIIEALRRRYGTDERRNAVHGSRTDKDESREWEIISECYVREVQDYRY